MQVAVCPDYEGGTLDAHVFLPVHTFLNPNLVSLCDLLRFIADQRKGKSELVDKLLMALGAVRADSENNRTLRELIPGVAQSARLRGAPGRIVLWVEIEDDRLSQ